MFPVSFFCQHHNISFSRVLARCEMQTASSWIRTRVIVSSSYGGNHYTTNASYVHMCVYVCILCIDVCIYVYVYLLMFVNLYVSAIVHRCVCMHVCSNFLNTWCLRMYAVYRCICVRFLCMDVYFCIWTWMYMYVYINCLLYKQCLFS